MSLDLPEFAGAVLNAGLTAMSNGCKLTSRRTTKVINTTAESAPVRKAANIRGIRVPTQAPLILQDFGAFDRDGAVGFDRKRASGGYRRVMARGSAYAFGL
jgi:hypothetical protein